MSQKLSIFVVFLDETLRINQKSLVAKVFVESIRFSKVPSVLYIPKKMTGYSNLSFIFYERKIVNFFITIQKIEIIIRIDLTRDDECFRTRIVD